MQLTYPPDERALVSDRARLPHQSPSIGLGWFVSDMYPLQCDDSHHLQVYNARRCRVVIHAGQST